MCIRDRDIEKSLQFYSLLGLDEERRFRSGAARCAWLRSAGGAARLELVEVPDYVDAGRAADGLAANHVGLNHVALDVSHLCDDLGDFLRRLNDDSERLFEKSLGLALPPRQQIIGQEVYELAFVRDADGVLVELLRRQATLDAPMEPDWQHGDTGHGRFRCHPEAAAAGMRASRAAAVAAAASTAARCPRR